MLQYYSVTELAAILLGLLSFHKRSKTVTTYFTFLYLLASVSRYSDFCCKLIICSGLLRFTGSLFTNRYTAKRRGSLFGLFPDHCKRLPSAECITFSTAGSGAILSIHFICGGNAIVAL